MGMDWVASLLAVTMVTLALAAATTVMLAPAVPRLYPRPSHPNQFILRLPTEPAKALREALRSGAGNIKERLSIQLEHEKGSQDPRLRRGIIEFDGWNMHAKVNNFPGSLN